MHRAVKIEIVSVDGTPGKYYVHANGELVGMVARAAISLSGEPEYVAHWIPAPVELGNMVIYPSAETHPVVFSGDFANVQAVALILDKTGSR